MFRLASLRALVAVRPRRAAFADGRASIAYADLPAECLPALRTALLSASHGRPEIAWVEVNPRLRRVVFAADNSRVTLASLVALVEQAEQTARDSAVILGPQAVRPTAHELPDDELELLQQWVELAADVAGLGYGLLLRVVPFVPETLAGRAVVLLSLVQESAKLREPLEARLGTERTDLLLSLLIAQAQGLSRRPLSSLLDIARRGVALRGSLARSELYERLRPQLLERATSPALFGDRAELVRPRALPRGPIESVVERAWLPAAGAFSMSLLATRELGRSVAAWFGALPTAAKVGHETFVTELGRMLAERGMLVLSTSALEVLDRIDTVVIDRTLLLHTRLSLGEVSLLSERPVAALRAQAQALFDPEEPLASRTRGGYQLAPLGRSSFAADAAVAQQARVFHERGSLVLALSAVNGARDRAHAQAGAGQLLALIELQIAARPGGERLIELARELGLRVLLADDVERSSDVHEPGHEGIPVMPLASLASEVRALQQQGRAVCVMAASDRVGLSAADCAIAVLRRDQPPPFGAHILCKEDVSDCSFVLRAIMSARAVSAESVQIAWATAVSNTLIATSTKRQAGRNVVFMSSATSLLAMGNALLKAAGLRAEEVRPADSTPFHALEVSAVLARLGSSSEGLLDQVAAQRGRDIAREPGLLRELAVALRRELNNPLTPFIAAGAGLSALVGSRVDAALVGGTGLLGALLGAAQQVRTDRALRRLVSPARQPVSVLREQRRRLLPDDELVVGDVVLLRAGDVVPADCRVIESAELEVDGASLTGESLPSAKHAAASFEASLADRSCMLYAGTTLVSGRAKAVVVAVGEQVEALRASSARQRHGRTSGVEARLRQLTDLTLPVASVGAAAVMISGLLRGRKAQELIASSISMGVAALPEGLPLLATAAQLSTARRLTRRGALVRNASCVEALGRVDVVCIDKTGTLTEGTLELAEVATLGRSEGASTPCLVAMSEGLRESAEPARASIAPDGGAWSAIGLLDAGRTCVLGAALRATPDGELGNTTDAAIVRAAQRASVRRQHAAAGFQLHTDFPFASSHGYHAVLARTDAGPLLTIKGALERVLPYCVSCAVEGQDMPLDEATRVALLDQASALAARGLRVLAVAERRALASESLVDLAPRSPQGLCLLGVLGFRDPVRASAASAVEKLRQAGVRVVMLTGDHVETARNIAREVGLLVGADVLDGGQLAQLDDAKLREHVDSVALFARVTPAQKVRVVRALEERGHVVAMVGDGANDAPAMRCAQVGIAVGQHCAAAAQAAADIVLPAADIASLLEGIVDARAMWLSIRDAVSILLGGNLGEIGFASVGGLLSGAPPLNPRQLLLVNLLTDVAPAMAVAMRTPPGDWFEQLKQQRVDDLLGQRLDRAIALRALSTALGASWAWGFGRLTGSRARASTMALTALVGTQLGQTIAARGADRRVLTTSVLSGLLLAGIVQTPGVSHFFGCRPLGPIAWTVAMGASTSATFGGLAWNRIERWFLERMGTAQRTAAGDRAPSHVLERGPVQSAPPR